MKKVFVVISLLVLIGAVGFVWFFPDALLYLRATVVQTVPPETKVVKQFAWTPGEDVKTGAKKVTFKACDDKGTCTNKVITVNVLPVAVVGVPQISDVVITPSDTSATITWKSDIDGIANLDFDLRKGPKHNTTSSDKSAKKIHQIIIPNLVPCTTYVVQPKVKTNDKEGQDIERTFTTTGCAGNANVTDQYQADISSAQGGMVALSGKINVEVPANSFSQDAQFQVKQLDRDVALGKINTPDGLSAMSGLYDVHALKGVAGDADKISTFTQPVKVTLNYTANSNTDVAGYRYDGSVWNKLDNCTPDTTAQTVSCTTTGFSTFGVFGKGAVTSDAPTPTPTPSQTPTPTPNAGSGNSGGGGGGNGGGGGSSDNNETEANVATRPLHTYTYQAENGQTISGPYSGIVKDGTRTVAKLASGKSMLEKKVTTAKDGYCLDIAVKDDMPGNVKFATYVNNRVWKVAELPSNDNKYRIRRIGLLRNFSGGTISFRLINDTYDKNDPSNENKDRNLFIDFWSLTTCDKVVSVPLVDTTATGGGKVAKRTRSAGWAILPNLNQIISEELGQNHVVPQVWETYAKRLTVSPSSPESIQTEGDLRNLMRYRKGQGLDNPKK